MTGSGRVRRKTRTPRASSKGPNSQEARLRALRSRSDTTSGDAVVVATIRYRVSKNPGVGAFSAAHPEVRIEFLTFSGAGPNFSVSDCWISGHPAGRWTTEISRLPDGRHVECLSEVGDGCLYRVTFRNPPVVYLYRRMRLPVQTPIWMQGGFGGWEVVARYSQFRRILEFVRRVDPGARVVRFHRGPLRSHLPSLTDTQKDILSTALAEGYFEVPRRVSLSELAHRLHRSPSALSEVIATIERKLLDSSLDFSAFRSPGFGFSPANSHARAHPDRAGR